MPNISKSDLENYQWIERKMVQLEGELTALKDKMQESQEELRHYREAMSAVKWLLGKMQTSHDFQL